MASSITFRTERTSPRGSLWWWVGVLASASVVLGCGLFALTRTSLFRVREIRVEGVVHGSPARLVRLSGITTRDNAFWLDERAAEMRLRADPWVDRADVSIDLPSRVTIRITERSPVGIVDLGSGPLLVDDEGRIIGPGPGRGLPVIEVRPPQLARFGLDRGIAGAARALGALDASVRSEVDRVVEVPGSGLELVLHGGVRVRYGSPSALAAKGRALAAVLTWAERSGTRLREVDLVAPGAPAVVASD